MMELEGVNFNSLIENKHELMRDIRGENRALHNKFMTSTDDKTLIKV